MLWCVLLISIDISSMYTQSKVDYSKDGSLANSKKPQEAQKELKTFHPITARGTF